jgi:hypothetical protein
LAKPKERDRLEDLSTNWRIKLKLIKKWDIQLWAIFFWLRTGRVADSCEEGRETSGSVGNIKFITKREILSFSRRI